MGMVIAKVVLSIGLMREFDAMKLDQKSARSRLPKRLQAS